VTESLDPKIPPADANSTDHEVDVARLRRDSRTSDLIDRIRESADKLERDGSSRGDLKLLSRAIRELRYAFKVFGPYRHNPKVTVFGSARTPANDPSYQMAVDFGRGMAERGWLVVTGAANGIMEAGHVGAGREKSMGLNIMLPFEQDANPIIDGDDKLVHMKYFFTRKLMFVKECHAVVCFPGGFGTLDETLEVLTLLQTGKRELVPLVLAAPPRDDYWNGFHRFVVDQLLSGGMISADDLSLYKVTHSTEEAIDEVIGFYRVYNSMRYVGERLVLRLNYAPNTATLAEVNERFGDIVVKGRIELGSALPPESDQPDLSELPRLMFRFDRRSHGQLRKLIDFVNEKVAR
jgi:uncharacterized protein (TIGR00730 family)